MLSKRRKLGSKNCLKWYYNVASIPSTTICYALHVSDIKTENASGVEIQYQAY